MAEVRKVERDALITPGSDAGLRVLALASSLEDAAQSLSQVVERYERVRA